MINQHVIPLYKGGTKVGEVSASPAIKNGEAYIECVDTFGDRYNFSGDDFFLLLKKLGSVYEINGMQLLCNGMLIDVFPGGLASEETLGEIAYKFDEASGVISKVNIFHCSKEAGLENLSSFECQKNTRRAAIRTGRFKIR